MRLRESIRHKYTELAKSKALVKNLIKKFEEDISKAAGLKKISFEKTENGSRIAFENITILLAIK